MMSETHRIGLVYSSARLAPLISGNTSVTLQTAGTNTLAISGGTGTDLYVQLGSSLTVSGTNALTIAVASAAIRGLMFG